MDLKLWLLGPPRIEVGGEPLRVDTRKATALLIYLTEQGEPQRRERLAAIFWPESDTSHSKAALRRTLSTLRKAAGGDWVSADRNTVSVKQPWTDSLEFRELIARTREHGHDHTEVCEKCIEPLGKAVVLYRDSFLSGFTLPDSPDFDEWQYFTGQSLLAQYSDALQRLVLAHAGDRNFEQAIEYATRRLALDPLNESAHRDLMTLHSQMGQRGLALQQYRDCVRVLQEELGAPPLEETVELYERIKGGELETESPYKSLATDIPLALAKLPLVGRDTEYAQIQADYSNIDRNSCLIVIEGEAGVGKTRIAEEFIESNSTTVFQARCYPDESSVAYRPWIDALRASLSLEGAIEKLEQVPTIWLAEASRLLPEIPDIFSQVDRPSGDLNARGQDRFMNGLVQVLGALSKGDAPGILFLDDLQWADEASLDLLAYLVRRGPEPPMLVLATWRIEAAAEEQRLRAWVAGMPKDSARVLSLQMLSEPDVKQLVAIIGSEAPAQRLYEETEGLPLFLNEYLAALEAGTIETQHGKWGVPAQVQEVLRSRLASTAGASQQLLSAAAVIGRSFEFEVLRAVSGRSQEETVSGLETLISAGFVREYREQQPHLGPSYDFKHDKFRELVLAKTTQARQRLLHGRAAEALLHMRGSTSPGATASRIGRHLEASGNDAQAAELYCEAGHHARSLYANDEAVSHYQSALALGYEEPEKLHEAIADLQTLEGNYDLAAQEYETALAFQSNGRTPLIEHKLGNLLERWGKREQALGYYESAASSIQEAGARARVYADWSLTEHRQGHGERARELIELALSSATAAEDQRALAQCHNILGILARAEEDGEAAKEYLAKSLQYSERMGDPGARIAALNNLALAMSGQGELESAIELEREALKLSEELGDRHRSAALHSNLADMLHEAGDSQAAEEHLRLSAALFAEVGETRGSYEPEVWKLVDW